MKSENYRTLLNNEYKNQELSADDFDSTLIHFAKLYHAEQLRLGAVVGRSEQLVCPACDSQVIVSDERHNIKMCGVCKNQWAN
jgi:hypothetical protein